MALVHKETIQNVNRFLTNFATGYKQWPDPNEFIAPGFKVKFEDGKYTEYTKSVLRIYDDKISGSEKPKEVQWDVDEATYSCEEYSLGKFVSDKKKAQAEDPVNLDRDAVKMVKKFHMMSREYRISNIAGNAAVVTNNGTPNPKWDTALGTPLDDIKDQMATIQRATAGYIPNKIAIETQVAIKMTQTTQWQNTFRGTDIGFKNGLWNIVAGLRWLGLEPFLLNNFGLSEAKCTASDPTSEPLWDKKALLFYSEPTPSLETRTFMYSPFIARDLIITTGEPRRRGLYHDIYSDIDELLVDVDCAYLFTACIS